MITRAYGYWLARTFAGTTLEEAQALLAFDRAVDPGRCWPLGLRRCGMTNEPLENGWPTFPNRRGLDCSHGLQLATYQSRANLRRPLGPAERHHWARRRTLDRRAARAVSQIIREGRGYPIGWGEPW